MPDSETSDPKNHEPVLNLTMRLPGGELASPYGNQQPDLSLPGEGGRTLKVPVGMPEPGAGGTQRLVFPGPDETPLRVQKVDQPLEAAGQTMKVTFGPVSKPLGWKVPVILGSLVVLGGGVYLAFFRNSALPPSPKPVPAHTIESVPPAAQATFEQAKAGDVRAMHMLGLMYYNGLNIPQDREKGLYWLRKAAEKGSVGARVELSQIEGGR